MMKAIVVGAGAIGLCAAYQLALDGHDVTVVEASTPGAGASRHNAGWIVPILSTPVPAPGMARTSLRWLLRRTGPLHVRPSLSPAHLRFLLAMLRHCNPRDFTRGVDAFVSFVGDTTALFDAYERDGVSFEMHRQGLLLAFRDASRLTHYLSEIAAFAAVGHEAEAISVADAREVEPALSADLGGVLRCPAERHVAPGSFIDGLTARCRALQVTFCDRSPVTSIAHRRGVVTAVRTAEGELSGDLFVLSAGVWTGQLTRMLGRRLPIRPGKGYGYDLNDNATLAGHAVYLTEAKVALSPMASGLRVAGTMDFSDFDDRVDQVRAAGLLAALNRYLTGWTPPRPEPVAWSGLRPMTPDGLPCIGWLTPYTNVLVAAGHAMLGITLGPATARALTQLVAAGAPRPDLHAFDPDRFA